MKYFLAIVAFCVLVVALVFAGNLTWDVYQRTPVYKQVSISIGTLEKGSDGSDEVKISVGRPPVGYSVYQIFNRYLLRSEIKELEGLDGYVCSGSEPELCFSNELGMLVGVVSGKDLHFGVVHGMNTKSFVTFVCAPSGLVSTKQLSIYDRFVYEYGGGDLTIQQEALECN